MRSASFPLHYVITRANTQLNKFQILEETNLKFATVIIMHLKGSFLNLLYYCSFRV